MNSTKIKFSKSRRIVCLLISLCARLLLPATAGAAVGVSTRFVDVTLERLNLGGTYNLRLLRNIPYTVKNTGDVPMEIQADVIQPKKEKIISGYESIPDPNWVKIIPNKFMIPPGQTAYAEMIIQIPDDPALQGRHFQAAIWAHTLNKGLFAAGTMSRLRFSVGPGPESLKEEAQAKAMMTLDFDITPPELYVNNIEPGKEYNLNDLVQKKLKITNRAETPIKMNFKSVEWVSTVNMTGDFQPCPNPSWLTFSPPQAVVKGERIVTVNPILKIPIGDEHKGKKYAFLLKADLIMGVELDVYGKIYVTVKP